MQDHIKQALNPNEKIIWTGKPIPVFYTMRDLGKNIPMIVFCFLLLSIILNPPSYSWTELMSDLNMYHFIYPFVLFFFFVVLNIISLPAFRYFKDKNTVYLLTDTRAIIFIGRKNIKTVVYKPENPREIYISNKENGIGDVVIHTEYKYTSDIAGSTSQIIEYGFLRIKQAEKVLKLVQKLALKYNIAKNAK